MPIENGEYQKLTKEEIQARLETELEDRLNTTAQPGELVTQQLAAEAETLAENQEEAIQRVYEAAYIADANGEELGKLVDLIGIQRKSSTSATGTVRFSRESAPKATYTIPTGSVVQTGGTEALEFETTQQGFLRYIDGFEDGNLTDWSGDVSAFSITAASDKKLEIPNQDDADITTKYSDFKVGTTFTQELTPGSGSTVGLRFGVQDQSNYYECEINQTSQDLNLRLIESGSETALSTNTSATIPTQSIYIELEWSLYGKQTATVYETESRDVELCSVELDADAGWERGAFSVSSLNADPVSLLDDLATRQVLVNIAAVDTGSKTNLGPNSITDFKGNITGIQYVSNPVATGNLETLDTNRSGFVLGEARETDEELRERAFNSTSIGGAATVNALRAAITKINGVKSMTLNRNREGYAVNGMPGKSFEAVVYGGQDEDIGRAIFNTASIDSNDVGGINGTAASYTITSDVTKDTEEINWSRPVKLNLKIDVSLVVDDNYVGENQIRSIITNYIGGIGLDETFITGLNVGEDIYRAVLARKVVNPETTGVWEMDSISIDKNDDGNNDITTTASGAEILSVTKNEVAVANARDGSINITTTQK